MHEDTYVLQSPACHKQLYNFTINFVCISDPRVGYVELTLTFVFKEIASSEAQNMLIT
jgi:hypothetical protein